jgi:uncharacterized OsmC-like protein
MAERFSVGVGAGSLREVDAGCLQVPHTHTRDGISVRGEVTGAHVLHLAVACCVLNDVYREARARTMAVNGVYVTAEGGFEEETWASTGVEYSVAIDSGLLPEVVDDLVLTVEQVAEIPRALRQGVEVRRVGHV